MEIERKYRIVRFPDNLEAYSKHKIEQGYLCINPVIRIRRSDDDYILTYKSKIGLDEKYKDSSLCISNEIEVPLNKEGYEHLKCKVDNNMIYKTRYIIPLDSDLKAELDIFEGVLNGLYFVEVEFQSEEEAEDFIKPDWFGEDVSQDIRYKNNFLASVNDFNEIF